ncbi:MAG: glycerophosphodiester phosphodiesterase family protein [Nannocystaceae bacterium]
MAAATRPVLMIPGRPRPWIMAHRGASDLAPENSVAAFRRALHDGADLIETDLWCLADGELACMHDPTLARTTGDPRRVTELDRRALSRLRLRPHPDGSAADERVPLLEELVALAPAHVPLVLELKDPRLGEPRPLQRLLAVLGDRARERRAAVIAFDLGLLLRIRERAPGLLTGHIASRSPWGNQHTDMLGPYWPHLLLNPCYVRTAHRRRQRVCPLDPGLHRRLRRYLALDVDAVLTNDPAATRAEIERLRRER